jgi:hypothetical protein
MNAHMKNKSITNPIEQTKIFCIAVQPVAKHAQTNQ